MRPFEVPAGRTTSSSPLRNEPTTTSASAPGYLATGLHRSIGPDPDFRFVNIAHWASAEDLTAAITDQSSAPRHKSPTRPPALYTAIAE